MTTTRGRARRGATAGNAARRGVETLALAATLAATLATTAGCRTQWEPSTLAPEATLQWPWLPGAAKVRYDHALTGMEARSDARGVLENVVLGRRGPDGAFQLPVAAAEGPSGSDGASPISSMRRIAFGGTARLPLAHLGPRDRRARGA